MKRWFRDPGAVVTGVGSSGIYKYRCYYMNNRLCYLVVTAMLLLCTVSSPLPAVGMKGGIGGRYNIVQYSDVSLPDMACRCNTFNSGSGSGYAAGVVLELETHILFDDRLQFRTGYQSLPLEKKGEKQYQGNTPEGPAILTVEKKLGIGCSIIYLEMLYKVSLFGSGFFVSLGPGFNWTAGSSTRYSQDYNGELFLQYYPNDEGSTKQVLDYGRIPGSKDLFLNFKGGLYYEFGIGKFTASLGASYNYCPEAINSAGWKINILQLGFDLLYPL